MPRTKAPGAVADNRSLKENAFSNRLVTDHSSVKDERDFVDLLLKKQELYRSMGKTLYSNEDLEALIPGNTDPTERMVLAVMRNLNKYSVYSPEFKEIVAVTGETSRLRIAQKMAQKLIANSAMKRSISRIIGVQESAINSVGDGYLAADFGRQRMQLALNPMIAATNRRDSASFNSSQ